MKLLIITQKVDKKDSALGFFYEWIETFSKSCESVEVIALHVGDIDLPENVSVHNLKIKNRKSIIARYIEKIRIIFSFYKTTFSLRSKYDAVFVHMNPIYIVLYGIFWKLQRKKISLWYVHKAVDLKLRIATLLTDIVFTSSKESFRIETDKTRFLNHGINTNLFKCRSDVNHTQDSIKIVYIGRITEIKDLKTLIKCVASLFAEGKNVELSLIGEPIYKKDFEYLQELKSLIHSLNIEDHCHFIGGVPHEKLIDFICDSNIMVNLTPTGGMDKVVIESMSCGIPVITSNEAFREVLGHWSESLIFRFSDPDDLKEKILNLKNIDINELRNDLIEIAEKRFSLKSLIDNICSNLKS